MKYIALLLLSFFSVTAFAGNTTCTAPSCSVTSQGSLVAGVDSVIVTAGTYTTFNITHLTGIVIINRGGQVICTAHANWNTNLNCKWTGIGSISYFYGFQMYNITGSYGCVTLDTYNTADTLDHIEQLDGTVPFLDNQQNTYTYDTTGNTGKRLLKCIFHDIHLQNAKEFLQNFRNWNLNTTDSCEAYNIIVDTLGVQTLLEQGSDWNIHDWTVTYNSYITLPNNDHALFEPDGGSRVYRCVLRGNYLGWFYRQRYGFCLNHRGDNYIYDNLRIGGQHYGFVDYSVDTVAHTPTTNRLRGGDVYVYHNTMGNMYQTSASNWYCTIGLTYGMQSPSAAGFQYTWHAHNNVRFNCINYHVTNAQNFAAGGSNSGGVTWDTAGADNQYYDAFATFCQDTVNCYLIQSGPANGTGTSSISAYPGVSQDYRGTTRPPYSAGYVEYFGALPPPPTTRNYFIIRPK